MAESEKFEDHDPTQSYIELYTIFDSTIEHEVVD